VSARKRKPSAKAAALLGIDIETTAKSPSIKRRSSSRSKTPSKAVKAVNEWKPKNPPVLNCSPPGYTPGWATENLFLCPANIDYLLADAIVPWLYMIGVNTPNKITVLNCVLRAYIIYLLLGGSYVLVTVLLPVTQVRAANTCMLCPLCSPLSVVVSLPPHSLQILDCADGQCARRYSLGSEFGAWLDHFTDEMFGWVFAFSVFYLIHLERGVYSPHFISILMVFAVLGVGGKATFEAKESGRKFKDFEFKHILGMYEEYYMTYIYIALMTIYVQTGAFPSA
jgi:phosphatidylglycerophosphate synthase